MQVGKAQVGIAHDGTAQVGVAQLGTAQASMVAAANLEGVMNSNSDAIAWGHAEPKTLPKRRFRRGVGFRGSVSGTRSRRCTPTQPGPAREVLNGLRWVVR